MKTKSFLRNHLVYMEAQTSPKLSLNIANKRDDTILAGSGFQGLCTRSQRRMCGDLLLSGD